MHDSEDSPNGTRSFGVYMPLLSIALSLATIGGAFWLSMAEIDEQSRLIGFAGVIAVFVGVCVATYLWHLKRRRQQVKRRRQQAKADSYLEDGDPDPITDTERSLAELDEAREFFSGSLRLADAFRLISHRISDVMPFRAIVLHLLDDRRRHLKPVHSDGIAIEEVDDDLADQSYASGTVEIDSYLEMDSTQDFGSSAAIPLRHGSGILGVVQVYFGGNYNAIDVDKYLFEAIGERVAPLILGSLSYERSHAKALTDITTELPNERAFYLMLEKQIAELHHNRCDDPLTVLAIDIKSFETINEKYGHAVGDRALNFVAQITRDSLRQMDFLARSINDEFLAILPTASLEISQTIIERIHHAITERRFEVNDDESLLIELNIGWATYENEGRTPGELLSFAELKKEQQKMPFGENVVAFPQEFVN